MTWTLRDICEQTQLEHDSGTVLLCDQFHEGKLTVLISVTDKDGFPIDTYVPVSAMAAFIDRITGSIPRIKNEVTFE